MPDQNTIDSPSLCEELSTRVPDLEAQLAEEKDKNAVVVQQIFEVEDHYSSIMTRKPTSKGRIHPG